MRSGLYKGILYWGRYKEWRCYISDEPFHTLTELKAFIGDMISCTEDTTVPDEQTEQDRRHRECKTDSRPLPRT